ELAAQYRREWYARDLAAPLLEDAVLPTGLTALEEREALRARKGLLVRHEVRLVQPMAGERHPVLFAHERESVSRHYERDPSDPRVEHRFTIEVDDFGNVLRSAHIGYPRRIPAEPEQG